jgi:hypothetical protein
MIQVASCTKDLDGMGVAVTFTDGSSAEYPIGLLLNVAINLTPGDIDPGSDPSVTSTD